MKKIVSKLAILLLLGVCVNLDAQISEDQRTLFTIGDKEINVADFEYVYTKNNISGDADYSEASLNEYLDLYVNFRLKVLEAESRGLDTVSAINKELDGYRKQLSKSYLTDKTIFDELVKEAYERMKKEIHVKHIMVQVEPEAFPQDTLVAYQRIMDVRKRLQKGEKFEDIARLFSDDQSVKSNGGDLGYLTVFQTVYPFENAMYNTKADELSKPVRTQFGYHILKVEGSRESRGSVQIAQILKKMPKDANETDMANLDQKIHSIYKQIMNGEMTFEEAVKAESDDNQTNKREGVLANPYTGTNWFETGQLFGEIEDVAYELEVGAISKPIKTDIGWHIIKLVDKRGIQPFSEVKNQLKAKVERDSRSRVAQSVMLKNIQKEYGFTENEDKVNEMYEKIPSEVLTGEWEVENPEEFQDVIFSFAGKDYKQIDFIEYLTQNLKRSRLTNKTDLLKGYYNRYVEKVCFDHEETQLERKDPYFRALMKEYRDGILLFELTDDMVWTKAIKDTSGLEEFHEKHKDKYMWEERADVVKFESKDKATAELVKKLAKKKSPSDVVGKVNKKIENGVIMRTGKYEKGHDDMVDSMKWEKGNMKEFENSNGTITLVQIRNIIPAGPKKLHEAKGYVVSDYQEYLEKRWIEDLKEKYPVDINESVFNSLIK